MPRSIGILETFAVEKVSIFIPVDEQTISEILHDSQTCGSILSCKKGAKSIELLYLNSGVGR